MKILVTGDSWAAGDWNTKNGTDSHLHFSPVLVDLLEEDGHEVIHCPNPGQSDLPSVIKIKENIENIDFIIFFKTDIFRCFNKKRRRIAELNKKEYNLLKGSDWPSFEDYINLTNEDLNLSDNIIKEMNSYGLYFIFSIFLKYYNETKDLNLSLMYLENKIIYDYLFENKNKILIIGGEDSIKTNLKFPYQIRSLTNFLIDCPDDHYCINGYNFDEFIKLVKQSKLKKHLSDILIKSESHIIKTLDRKKAQHINDSKYFKLDTNHPNETAIKLYYHKLIKPILEEIENDYRATI